MSTAPSPVESLPAPGAPAPAGEVIPVAAAAPRLDAIDWVRGLVMVMMLLDHTRDFVHVDALRFRPEDLTQTTAVLFFTRWVTHFCAPVFVFLAGTSVALQVMRGKERGALSRFLMTRGLWLMVLEFTLISAALGLVVKLDFARFVGAAEVIWVISVSMVVMAGLIRLPTVVSAVLGLSLVVLHHLVDGVQVAGWRGPGTPVPDAWGTLWMALHQQGMLPLGDSGLVVFVMYPLVPWVGVAAAGYAFGHVYGWAPERRQRLLVRLGLALAVGFLALRALNVYGDPSRWAPQSSALFTALSFLNVSKYPPSLLFLMMTLGPALLALAWAERTQRGAVGRAIVTFGRVPLFYFLMQWPVVYLASVVLGLAAGRDAATLLRGPGAGIPGASGFSLWVAYAAWGAGLLVLFLLCRWYAGVKQRSRAWWLRYL